MIAIRRYDASERQAWDEFVNASKTPMFMFNRGFMEYHADRFEDASLMFWKDEELVAVLPASRHGVELRSHGGLTYGGVIAGKKMHQTTMLDCFGALKVFCREQGVESVVYKAIPHIYQVQPAQEDLYALFRNGAVVEKIEPSVAVRLKEPLKMPKGRKAQVSRARREGVEVRETEDFDSFISLENEVLMARHGARAVHSADELRLLKSRFPEQIRCFGGFLKDKLIAGALLFVYPTTVHTQYLCADETAREIGGLDLVVASVMERYRATHEWLDFGISTEDAGRVLNEGLIAQKEGFGGRTVAYETFRLDVPVDSRSAAL